MTIEQEFSQLLPWAQYYGQLGWKILPVHGIGLDGRCTCGQSHDEPKDIGKHPAVSDWQTSNSSSDPQWIEAQWQKDYRYNVGVMCRNSGFLVVDIDPRNGGLDSFDRFEQLSAGEALPDTVEAMTGAYSVGSKAVRGRHLFYKVSDTENLSGNLKAQGFPGIDIKHNGYVLLTPSRHLSGVNYEWLPGHAPWEMEMTEAPEELLKTLRKGRARSGGGGGGRGRTGYLSQDGVEDWYWVEDLEWKGEKLDLDRYMNEGIDEGSRAVDLYAMTCALGNKYGTSDADRKFIETMMVRFNATMVKPPLPLEGQGGLLMHVHRALDFVAENPKTKIAGAMGPEATMFAQRHIKQQEERQRQAALGNVAPATEFGTSDPDAYYEDYIEYVDTELDGMLGGQVKNMAYSGRRMGIMPLDVPKDQDALTVEAGGEPGRRSLSDLGNGRRLVDTYQAVMRYTPGLGWFNWDEAYWEPDKESLKTRELSKTLSAVIAREVVNYEDTNKQTEVIKWANKAKSNGAQGGAIESATSDPRVLLGVEEWDADPTLFGVANGVINLKSGELMKGRPDLYITRRSPVRYSPGVRNPRWEAFLDFATGGDKEYQEWLQRAAGYTLTGLRTHDVMFLMYGPGGTGKNVFCEAIVKCLGTTQYAWPMDSQILAQGDGSAHGSDLYHWAELRGRRMVWVDELPESERLKENSVKKLTGSSEISARSPGEKPFTFQSRAKLWVTTNHRPIISDDAMWRRIRPIPWMNIPTTPDPGLKEYIFDPEGGLPGVLAWAVEGAMKILNSKEQDTLGWCKVVSEAAEIYRKNEDRIGMFLNEETHEVPGSDLPIRTMYSVYQQWSEDRGEKPMSQIAFQRKLTERGFQITGQGRKAVMGNRGLIPRTAGPASGFDWSDLANSARF